LIFGVPNCEPFLREGDISILFHEHFSYFTMESIVTIAQKLQLNLSNISEIKGMLLFTLSKGGTISEIECESFPEAAYLDKVDLHFKKLRDLFCGYLPSEIAVYVPGRALNTFFLLDVNGIRLIDDNTEMHGKYLPYFQNPVMSLDELLLDPPKLLFIYSRTFGEKVKQRCLSKKQLANTRILTISDV
jgi:hypothetical protein